MKLSKVVISAASLVLISAAPWVVKTIRKEAHRELLRGAFKGEKVEIVWDVVVFDPDQTSVAVNGRGCLIRWNDFNSSSKCIQGTEWQDLSNRQYN